jgi:hypothetical protein
VRLLEERMATDLALLEQQAGESGAAPIRFASADAVLAAARTRLQLAEQAGPRNDELVDALREAARKLERQLVARTVAGPFPVRASFTDRRTGETRPIFLFVGPAAPDPAHPRTWLLIDLTFPAFHRTHTGHGRTPGEALRAAFEAGRSAFRGNYPRGRILARTEWPDMERLGLPAFDFGIETESWERTAYEWLTAAATGLAVAGWRWRPASERDPNGRPQLPAVVRPAGVASGT